MAVMAMGYTKHWLALVMELQVGARQGILGSEVD